MNSTITLEKCSSNPVLSKTDVPYSAELIFNAGVTKFQGKYVMVFRNDYGFDEESFRAGQTAHQTNIGIAYSDDGIKWEVSPHRLFLRHLCTFRGRASRHKVSSGCQFDARAAPLALTERAARLG